MRENDAYFEQDGPVKIPGRIRRMTKEELDAECRRLEKELRRKNSRPAEKTPCKTEFYL